MEKRTGYAIIGALCAAIGLGCLYVFYPDPSVSATVRSNLFSALVFFGLILVATSDMIGEAVSKIPICEHKEK